MKVTLAFYKGRARRFKNRIMDTLIRFGTRSKYSHVELIKGAATLNASFECLSSSGRDGGVRKKTIYMNEAKWDLVTIDAPKDAVSKIEAEIGKPYDYVAIIFSQVFNFGRHDHDKWFCSEICAEALGLPDPHRFSPKTLFDWVTHKLKP